MSTLPSSIPSGPSTFSSVASGFLSGAAAGSIVPGIGTAIGGAVGAVAGLIGSIFGGGPDTPTEQQQVIDVFRAFFPNQNQPICGAPIDLSLLNGGQPLWMNVPCSDPSWGSVAGATESTVEWAIKAWGLGPWLSSVAPFLSSTIPGSQQPTTPTTPTSGLDANLGNLTTTLTSVIGAITGAIDASTNSAASGQASAINAVQQTLGTFTAGLGTLQNQIGNVITSSIGSLLDSLFNPSGLVTSEIAQAIQQLGVEQGGLLAGLTNAIESQIGPLEQSLLGLPISLGSILRDVFKNLPQILIDLVNVFPGPLKDIVHAIEVMTGHIPKNKSDVDYSDFGSLLKTIAEAGISIAGAVQNPDHVAITPRDSIGVSCGGVDELDQKLRDWIGNNLSVPCFVQEALSGMRLFFVELVRLLPFIEQFYQQGEELQNKSCGLTKLTPGLATNAWKRDILTGDALAEELAVQGWNAGRQQVLKDLATYLPGIAQIIDWRYRNVIPDEDFVTLLRQNGLTEAQIQATRDGSGQITAIEAGLQAFNRDLISLDELTAIFQTNRLNESQGDLYRVLSLRPPNPAEALKGQLTRDALGTFTLPFFSDFDTIPGWFTDATRHSGLDSSTTRYLWWAHWNLGGLNDWISAYYRGLRTLPELAAVAQSFGVPPTVVTDLIDIGRPLIPYRTIPGMIAAGTITEDQGKSILAKHGFDSGDIDILLRYAQRGTKSSKATTAQTQHDISLATARTAYDDGILTQDQYMQLLQAHGLDANAAGVEVQIANISQEVKARKQISTDIVNEYNAGLLDQQAAIQQLATSGLSVAEQAAAVRKMKSGASSKAKQPSEAELRAWAKADIITPDEYQNRLEVIGWAPSDAANFRAQHFPAA